MKNDMTKEEKFLIIQDVCARLPYGVIVEITSDGGMVEASYDMRLDAGLLADLLHCEDDFKPYLRPMSSMTEKEKKEYNKVMFQSERYEEDYAADVDWLNAHHFDYRGLIPMNLGIEAKEGMYKF